MAASNGRVSGQRADTERAELADESRRVGVEARVPAEVSRDGRLIADGNFGDCGEGSSPAAPDELVSGDESGNRED